MAKVYGISSKKEGGFSSWSRWQRSRGLLWRFPLNPVSYVAGIIGWLTADGLPLDQDKDSKSGMKNPQMYEIIGNVDDVWDDTK